MPARSFIAFFCACVQIPVVDVVLAYSNKPFCSSIVELNVEFIFYLCRFWNIFEFFNGKNFSIEKKIKVRYKLEGLFWCYSLVTTACSSKIWTTHFPKQRWCLWDSQVRPVGHDIGPKNQFIFFKVECDSLKIGAVQNWISGRFFDFI